MRLPSLLGGMLYLAMALRLARLLFGAGPAAFLCVALLGLNPFILDFLSAARGYGMALAFLLCALDQMVRYLGDGGEARLYRAPVALALAVAANLTFAVPGTMLAIAFALAVLAGERAQLDAGGPLPGSRRRDRVRAAGYPVERRRARKVLLRRRDAGGVAREHRVRLARHGAATPPSSASWPRRS